MIASIRFRQPRRRASDRMARVHFTAALALVDVALILWAMYRVFA